MADADGFKATVIKVDVSEKTIASDMFATCPLRNSEWNSCQALAQNPSYDGDCICVRTAVEDTDNVFGQLNPLCPVRAGAVIVKGER